MTTKEKIIIRIGLFLMRMLTGYSFNEDLKDMYTKINDELKHADTVK